MAELRVYSEGAGERGFIEQVLTPHLSPFGIYVRGAYWGHSTRSPSGGIRNWEGERRGAKVELVRALQQCSGRYKLYVTTMVDYYALPLDWPNRATASTLPAARRSLRVEEGMSEDIRNEVGDDRHTERFIPYVCLHELEALIFANPDALLKEFPHAQRQINALKSELGDTPPEDINDGPNTAPSKRIIRHLPEYDARKRIAATNTLRSIELDVIRQACPHFNGWLTRIESLGQNE